MTELKVGDVIRVKDADCFLSHFANKIKDRDAIVEWVGPDAYGMFKFHAKVRFLKRNGRGKEFSEIMQIRDLEIKQNG